MANNERERWRKAKVGRKEGRNGLGKGDEAERKGLGESVKGELRRNEEGTRRERREQKRCHIMETEVIIISEREARPDARKDY